MAFGLPTWFIDYLLYNYRYLCKEIASLDACPGGFARVPPRGSRPKSPVERVLIERADLTMVMDTVGRAWRRLPPELKEVAVLKYRRGFSNRDIQNTLFISRSTLDRKVGATRGLVAGYLAQIPGAILTHFASKLRPPGDVNVLYSQREQLSEK